MRTSQSEETEAARSTSGPRAVGPTVVGLSSAIGSTILTVRAPGASERDVVVSAAPDPVLARRVTAGLRRLAWVRVDLSTPVPRCRVFGTSRQPRSLPVPLAAALSLVDAGLPVVVRVPEAER